MTDLWALAVGFGDPPPLIVNTTNYLIRR